MSKHQLGSSLYLEERLKLKDFNQQFSIKTKVNPEYAVSYDNEDEFLSDDKGEEFERESISGRGDFLESESGSFAESSGSG